MTHEITVNNIKVIADFGCYHPKLENNTCPTGSGDCTNCKHCFVNLSVLDFMKIKEEKA